MAASAVNPNVDSFPQITTRINKRSKEFAENVKLWKPVREKYQNALRLSASEGSESSILKHTERGQLRARERVALLLDEDSPFLELQPFAGYENPCSSPAASLITGIGLINDVPTMIIAHIPSLKGGAWNYFTVQKQNRATNVATKNGLPIVALVHSAGIYLPLQFHVFPYGGKLFRDLSVRTRQGHQSCAVVFGGSTAGGAYHPALSDHTIFVKGQANVFLGGPPLVKMAIGETVDAEDLGGAEMHATVTGLADQLAVDEFDAIRKARQWVLTTTAARLVGRYSRPEVPPRLPLYDPEELYGIVNPDIRQPLDMMEVILRIVDDARLESFKPLWGKAMITTWAYVFGHLTGIIANQRPIISPDESDKSTQFVHICNQMKVPIVFLHNVTGFMVGLKAERAGLIKKGAKFVSAISTSLVPHISILIGASYGAGNYAMCGRAFKPRFLFAWPTSRCSAMGPEQLSGVMDSITRTSAERSARPVDEARLSAQAEALKARVERDSTAYRYSSYLHDDGIIDPRDTRDVLGICLEVVKNTQIKTNPGSRNLARI
ncbi:Carboxyl transferase domain-containing protein [Cladophialophora immunda]|nr:Carboxyl transferase domain-containing protein [Cladophialophora immunda]